MDAMGLPSRPNLAQYRKQATDLHDAVRSSDAKSIQRLRKHHPLLADLSDADAMARITQLVERAGFTPATFSQDEAQFIIARLHGFESWARFEDHIEAMNRKNSPVQRFERAADAVIEGDTDTLARLLAENAALIRQRSTRSHHATLLHYVSANGVEDFRQKTPANAVAIATQLLEAGADVDALADTYGGDSNQTTLNLLVSSVHPAAAGLQSALVETLLDHGAAIDGLEHDGSPLAIAIEVGYQGAAETLARRGATIDTIVFAAALGRDDLVRDMLTPAGTLKPGVRLLDVRWPKLSRDPREHLERALVWAAAFGRLPVVELLVQAGVNVNTQDDQGFTPLHWAAAKGRLDIAQVLLDAGANPQLRNHYGGNVVESTGWFAANNPMIDDYAPVFAWLERLTGR